MAERVREFKIPGKSLLENGTEFSVAFEGRYIFRWATIAEDGTASITGYGGRKGHGQWRSFPPSKIKVHRIDKVRGNV